MLSMITTDTECVTVIFHLNVTLDILYRTYYNYVVSMVMEKVNCLVHVCMLMK